ncbi:MAG: hypothetical protein K0Q63_897 [Paenibacillus sp.]|nr:hypothetical protein [Paenibacillus sp.]
MTPVKWLWIVLAAVVTCLIWLGLYYRDIQIPHWEAEGGARDKIIASGELDTVERIHKHVWDDTVWIGFGASGENETKYVFLKSDETTISVDASNVLPDDELKAKFRASKPDAKLIRLQPGMFLGSPAWEAYYESSLDGVSYQYYDFYSFDDEGKLLETYLLPG